MGFQDPQELPGLDLGPEVKPIGSAQPLDHEVIAPLALSRSLELHQMDVLLEIAQKERHGLWFSWLDPTGAPADEIGAAFGQELAISRSKIHELQIARERSEQGVLEKLELAIEEFNSAIGSYALAQDGMAIQEQRWVFEVSQIVPRSNLNTLDIEAVIQDTIANKLRVETLLAIYRVARSKIDRLLLQGFYFEVKV